MDLDDAKVKQFKHAIENNYWFEFFMGMFCIVSCSCYFVKSYNECTFQEILKASMKFFLGQYTNMKDNSYNTKITEAVRKHW